MSSWVWLILRQGIPHLLASESWAKLMPHVVHVRPVSRDAQLIAPIAPH